MNCNKCGAHINANDMFCGSCGNPINKTRCFVCGAELTGSEFCGKCGTRISGNNNYNQINTFNNLKYSKDRQNDKNIFLILSAIIITLAVVVAIMLVAKLSGISSKETNNETTSQATNNETTSKATNNETTSKESNNETTFTPSTSSATSENSNPVFTYVTASSIRDTDTEGGEYSLESVLSNNPMTKWVPSKASHDGISEWIQINASQPQYVKGIYILNGYHKSEQIWYNNNRVKSCTLSFSDGRSIIVTLGDTMDLIKIDLDIPVNTTFIRLTINSVYAGARWDDTAITYLSAY